MEEGDPLRYCLLPYIWVPSSPGLFLASLSAILARSPHNHLLSALSPNLSPRFFSLLQDRDPGLLLCHSFQEPTRSSGTTLPISSLCTFFLSSLGVHPSKPWKETFSLEALSFSRFVWKEKKGIGWVGRVDLRGWGKQGETWMAQMRDSKHLRPPPFKQLHQ